jgi:dihydroorotase
LIARDRRLSCGVAILAMLGAALASPHGEEPSFDLLVKGGHVIDPKNGTNARMDVAMAGDRIVAVAPSIDPARARRVADATGLFVVPGLIDIHAHVFYGTEDHAYLSNGFSAVQPDAHSFRSGVTTLVDVGGAGWRNFPQFKAHVIDRARTRVLAFLNIVGSGMKGGPVEQDLADMDARLTALRIRQHREHIVGIKVAHYSGPEWTPVDRAVQAGRETDVPVMIDFGGHEPALSLENLLLKHLRPGDIFTHTYADVRGRIPIVDDDGRVRPFVWEARTRGVVFDVGHGGGSFLYRQAVPATKEGFYPDVISTDLHAGSMNGGMKDILQVMSKFLNLGMPLPDVIRANTSIAAAVIRRPDLAHLGVGSEGDLAVLRVRQGTFGFIDTGGGTATGTQRLECELTVRAGEVVYDLNGISHRAWDQLPPPAHHQPAPRVGGRTAATPAGPARE